MGTEIQRALQPTTKAFAEHVKWIPHFQGCIWKSALEDKSPQLSKELDWIEDVVNKILIL